MKEANGFELERPATRLEGLIMLIRLTGGDALSQKSDPGKNPFQDVPVWANSQAERYVAYAFEKGYTKGVSEKRFDPSGVVSPEQFMTFILRALGYADGDDFVWDFSIEKAVSLGIISAAEASELRRSFNRDQVILASYRALNAKLKNSDKTLLEKLTASGAVGAEN
ncbi:hypothetical protein FACS1894171_2480 [Clostridia bacterium]|nr:hypothetical protein FACS1894171_2480 [Clostridia bacterium]